MPLKYGTPNQSNKKQYLKTCMNNSNASRVCPYLLSNVPIILATNVLKTASEHDLPSNNRHLV